MNTLTLKLSHSSDSEQKGDIMSYTNETTHNSIPLPLGTDKTTFMDYNESMETLDTVVFGAVGDAATAVSDAADAKTAAQSATSDVATLTASLATTDATVASQGTAITNLGNKINDVDSDLSDAICSVVEATATAAYAHAVGEYFWYNDTLYKTTQTIAVGDTIVPNTNCETVTVTTELLGVIGRVATLEKSAFGGVVDIKSTVPYTATSDGYFLFNNKQSTSGSCQLKINDTVVNTLYAADIGNYGGDCIYVKKGCVLDIANNTFDSDYAVFFRPFA